MDNASKALIIAGAILIAVMLVSLGVMLYNTASGVAETTIGSVEALGVSGFNAQFETYLGTGKSKSQAAGLVSKVIANNNNNDIEIGITFRAQSQKGTDKDKVTSTSDLSSIRNDINSAKNVRYDIEVSGDSTTNYGYNSDGTIANIAIVMTNR
ncbi:MAG: hypothetical protein J6C46_01055 [Clostridia bacterium]|nr:hypothetical protein [Clostridia bacterium]